jgi:hypothetical protein
MELDCQQTGAAADLRSANVNRSPDVSCAITGTRRGTAVLRSSDGTEASDAHNQLANCYSSLPRTLPGGDRYAFPLFLGGYAMELNSELPRRRRVLDRSNAHARKAVVDVGKNLGPLRARTAVIAARADRALSLSEREQLVDECRSIAAAFQASRVELLMNLMDAPRKVTGNSRVVDIERAIDSLELAVAQVLRRLKASG